MHTITLNIQNSMYEHFLYLLKSLDSKEIEIVNDVPLESSEEELLKRVKEFKNGTIKPLNREEVFENF
jgi:hypothetical protein